MAGLKIATSGRASKTTTPKAPKGSKPTKSSLSAEFVKDSDDESGEEILSTSQSKNPVSNHSKTTLTRPTPVKKPLPNIEPSKIRKESTSSRTSIISSDNGTGNRRQLKSTTDEYDETGSSTRETTPVTVKKKPITTSITQQKPQKILSNTGPTRTSAIRAPNASQSISRNIDNDGKNVSDESEDVGSATESESGRESESEDTHTGPSKRSKVDVQPQGKASTQPSQVFQPPPGFEIASSSPHASSKILEVLSQSNLVGKQVWHIAVPDMVPVTSIHGILVESVQEGTSIVSHKGADYSLMPLLQAETPSNQALLVPAMNKSTYTPSKVPITRTLHLQQLVKLPSRTHEVQSVPVLTPARPKTHVKAPRQQPQGLKMRYRPSGTSRDSDSDSSMEVAARPPEFRVPTHVDNGLSANKRKRSVVANGDHNASARSMRTKHKAHHDLHADVQNPIVEMNTSMNNEMRTISSPTKEPGAEVNRADVNEKKKRKKTSKLPDDQKISVKSRSILPLDVTKEAETIMPEEVVSNDTGINRLSPEKNSKEDKARRKAERRKRIVEEKQTLAIAHEETPRASGDAQRAHPAEYPRETSVHLPTPRHSSPQKAVASQDSQVSLLMSSQNPQGKETKEERAKRKEEKRKRKVAPDFS